VRRRRCRRQANWPRVVGDRWGRRLRAGRATAAGRAFHIVAKVSGGHSIPWPWPHGSHTDRTDAARGRLFAAHVGATIVVAIGAAMGAAQGAMVIGGPTAKGAPITGGATAVPQGEPLWNQLRQRPHRQPVLDEVTRTTAAESSTSSCSVSAAFAGASPRTGEGCASRFRRQDGWGSGNSTPP